MAYSLRRVGDGVGDSGSVSELLQLGPDGTVLSKPGRPEIGYCVLVGAQTARSYQSQDYWVTTPVLEILEDRGNYVRFRTGNSIYEWTSGAMDGA